MKQIAAGNSFGELALISSKPRAATIKCIEDSDFAVMKKQDYLKILSKIDEKSREELISFLAATPYFSQWSRNMIHKIIVCFSHKKAIKG